MPAGSVDGMGTDEMFMGDGGVREPFEEVHEPYEEVREPFFEPPRPGDEEEDRKRRIRAMADEIIERDGEILRRLAEGDEGLVQHMVENQIEPQERARELQAQGNNVEVAMVNTSPDAEGFLVKCIGCGREARMPFDPGSKAVMCPLCQRERM